MYSFNPVYPPPPLSYNTKQVMEVMQLFITYCEESLDLIGTGWKFFLAEYWGSVKFLADFTTLLGFGNALSLFINLVLQLLCKPKSKHEK